MELLTHALLGGGAALASRSPRSRLSQRQRLLLGAAAAVSPDIDFVAFAVDPLRYLADWHQGPTHSLLLLPLWALLIAAVFVAVFVQGRRRRAVFGEAAAVAALGLATHIAADAITAYGVMLWYPLSTQRFGLGATFVVDVWIAAVALGGVWLGLRLRRRAPAAIALGLVCLIVAGQAWLQQRALAVGHASAQAQGFAYDRLSAFAQPLSPLHWKLIATSAAQHRVAHLDLGGRGHWVPAWPGLRRLHALDSAYRSASQLAWQRHQRLPDPHGRYGFVEALWHDARFAPFRRFATHPALLRIDDGADALCVWFTDLRYDLPTLPEVFRYGFCRDGEHAPWLPYRLRYLSDAARQRLPRRRRSASGTSLHRRRRAARIAQSAELAEAPRCSSRRGADLHVDVHRRKRAHHAAALAAFHQPKLSQCLHVLVHPLHVASHPARQLAHRQFTLPMQRLHQRPAALGQAPEEGAGTLEIEHLALVLRPRAAPAGITKRRAPIRLQGDGQNPIAHACPLAAATAAMKSSTNWCTVSKRYGSSRPPMWQWSPLPRSLSKPTIRTPSTA